MEKLTSNSGKKYYSEQFNCDVWFLWVEENNEHNVDCVYCGKIPKRLYIFTPEETPERYNSNGECFPMGSECASKIFNNPVEATEEDKASWQRYVRGV